MTMIITRNYPEPPISQKEILRYAGCQTEDSAIMEIMQECLREISEKLTYKVCYIETTLTISADCCDFVFFKTHAAKLAENLSGCEKAILFAATIGTEIDRSITRYGHIAPSKALMMQAIGAERIEALCNRFCEDIKKETGVRLKPRFSPGYGDLPLDAQKDIFNILDPAKHIGLTLNDSLLMSPSKSVTAFVGILDNIEQ